MDYNSVIKEITDQVNQSTRSQPVRNQNEQMSNDDLMNRIALEIKRQGG